MPDPFKLQAMRTLIMEIIMYKTVIIDDNTTDLKSLRKTLELHCPLLTISAAVNSLESARSSILNIKPDLVFINPIIQKKSTLELMELRLQHPFEVIFISHNEKYSIQAIKHRALDYLLKPVANKDVLHAGKIALQRINDNYVSRQVDLLTRTQIWTKTSGIEKLAIPTFDGFVFLVINEIVRCEANGAYTLFFTTKKEKVMASKNIKEYEDILPSNIFFRIHNSHIVNLNRIHKYNKGRGGSVIMEDGSHIEVASRRRVDFLELFQ